MSSKLKIEDIRKEFEDRGFVLLTGTYKNTRQKFEFICTCGNKSEMRIDHLRRGVKCSSCGGNKKHTFEYVRDTLCSEGYTLLSNEYVDGKTKFKYMCPKGHIGETNFNNWGTGVRCSTCFGKNRYDFDVVKSTIEAEGYIIKDTCYHNKQHKLNLVCPNGHDYSVSWESWFRAGSRCPKCKKWGTSTAEGDLEIYVSSFGLDVKTNDRTVIKPYELDFVIPSKKIAIEYCGLYWHSEGMGKDQNYHLNKLKMCKNAGYKLITIFEDEWVSNKRVVKNKLNSILGGNNTTVVDINDCKVLIVGNTDAINFCNKYSLEEENLFTTGVGIIYKDKLVCLATFLDTLDGCWLITGMCRNTKYQINGWKNAILSFFRENFFWKQFNIELNKRWYDESYLGELGFNYLKDTAPVPWLFKSNKKRFSGFVKDKAKNRIIWDCGSTEFVKK